VIKGKPPRLFRIFSDAPVYFVTCCTLHRSALLANESTHKKFREYCQTALEHNMAVGRYVIMPDHIHLFVCGGREFNLGLWMRASKRALISRDGIWQPRFFDHVLRSDESYSQKWNYLRENPVRAGVVSDAEQWPYQGEIVIIDRA
jgi:putative transposase